MCVEYYMSSRLKNSEVVTAPSQFCQSLIQQISLTYRCMLSSPFCRGKNSRKLSLYTFTTCTEINIQQDD